MIASASALAFALFWLGLAFRLARLRRLAPPLPPARPDSTIPATTVLLPVRDEESNVVDCLSTLLAQGAGVSIRVIDDGSRDATRALVDAVAGGAGAGRIVRLDARPLAAGWSGKVNALASALDGVESEWLLLTDADTRHAPGLLARAHAAAAQHRLDALSLAGLEEAHGFGENLITPSVFALLDRLLGDWEPHARGVARYAVANGQYLLLRTEALRAIGGFAALVGQPLDDVALARALRAGGYSTGFRRAGDALRVRMYRGAGETIRGWRRNLALVAGDRPAIAAAVVVLAATSVALPLALLAGGALLQGAAAWIGGVLASAWIRTSSGNRAPWGLLFPIDVAALAAILVAAVRDRRRGRLAAWRGREIAPGGTS